ncbi:hypothetical protein Scep_002260 [Stephania cephalantha]|uniref:Uncharacterized protein n=1 Tax=Stephania cephalantha TaxID=152367 RepID=A0AAP0LDM3_9MAGN
MHLIITGVLNSMGFTYLTLSNSYNWIMMGYSGDKGNEKLSDGADPSSSRPGKGKIDDYL